jgi:hypothetical protein
VADAASKRTHARPPAHPCWPSGTCLCVTGSTTITRVPGVGRPTVPRTFSASLCVQSRVTLVRAARGNAS